MRTTRFTVIGAVSTAAVLALSACGGNATNSTGAKGTIGTPAGAGKTITVWAMRGDLGNTQIPSYAANGGLLDLTPYKKELQQGNTWLTGLELPATVDGKLYGVPTFAGDR